MMFNHINAEQLYSLLDFCDSVVHGITACVSMTESLQWVDR